jgi:hypothetical protein
LRCLSQIDNYVKLVSAEIRQVLVESESGKTQVAGVAGLNFGFTGKLNTPVINLQGYTPGGNIGTGSEIKLGVNLKQKMSNNSSIDLGLIGTRSAKRYSDYINPITQERRESEASAYSDAAAAASVAQAQWDTDKFNYEVDNGYGEPMENSHYVAASGASARPSNATGRKNFKNDGYWDQAVKRKTFILNPEIGYTKTLKSGNKLRVSVNANIVVSDKLNGFSEATAMSDGSGYWVRPEEHINIDLKNSLNTSRVNVGLTFTFGNKKKRTINH